MISRPAGPLVAPHVRAAARGRPAPLAVVDLAAFDANAAELLRRAAGRPVRLATKSVRVPELVERALAAGFRGLMAYSLREALWWARRGATDVLVGYPTADAAAVAELAADPTLRAAVTLMVDDAAHLALIERAVATAGAGEPRAAGGAGAAGDGRVRVCLDVDASLEVGPAGLGRRARAHLGVRRSPLREPAEVAGLARLAERRGCPVRGLMFYEAQVAGLPDTSPAVRAVKRASLAELAVRRGAVVAAVAAAVGQVELVNGGGTGSLAATAADPAVTELTAGSGLYVPTLFDGYRVPPGGRALRPAAFFALDVVRRPGPGVATLFSGGYVASGPPGASRVPTPVDPPGLRLGRSEGAGEVQTPVFGRAADGLGVGDRVWFRHAKAGELMERFGEVVLAAPGEEPRAVPTYRGLGLSFG